MTTICAISKEKYEERTKLTCDCGWSWVGHFMLAGPAQFGHMKEHVAQLRTSDSHNMKEEG